MALKFSDIGEFGFIESIKKEIKNSSSKVIKGIGDDCAVLVPYAGRVLLFTTDMLVEDIHFLKDTITPYQLGWKAVAVNLSDIAAMGGSPVAILISLGAPSDTDVVLIQDIYKGIKDICDRYSVDIAGGDTVASPDKLIINVSVIGDVKEDEILYRSGARPGERIYLTGNIGDSYAGLKILKQEISIPDSISSHFINVHNQPTPLIETGRAIATSRLAGSMIDISDGLLSDLGHICNESGVGAVIYRSKLPISPEMQRLSIQANLDPLDFALSGGEDYILLVTVPEKNSKDFELALKGKNLSPLYPIGEISKDKGIRMIYDDGSIKELEPKGFDHFSI
jgi:thiamine-monophosphate kinase